MDKVFHSCKFKMMLPAGALRPGQRLLWLIVFFTLVFSFAGLVLLFLGQIIVGGLLVLLGMLLLLVSAIIFLTRYSLFSRLGACALERLDSLSGLLQVKTQAPAEHALHMRVSDTQPQRLCQTRPLHEVLALDAERRQDEVRDSCAYRRIKHVRF